MGRIALYRDGRCWAPRLIESGACSALGRHHRCYRELVRDPGNWLLRRVILPIAAVLAADVALCLWLGSPGPLFVLLPGALWLARVLPGELRAYRASPPGGRPGPPDP